MKNVEVVLNEKEYKDWCKRTGKNPELKISKMEYSAYLGNEDIQKLLKDIYSGEMNIDDVGVLEVGFNSKEMRKAVSNGLLDEITDKQVNALLSMYVALHRMVGVPEKEVTELLTMAKNCDKEILKMVLCKVLLENQKELCELTAMLSTCFKCGEALTKDVLSKLEKEKKEAN